MQSVVYILFVCVLIILPRGNGSSLDEITEAHNLLQQTLKALKGTVDFFQKEYKHVNLDAIIGTRIVEGTIRETVCLVFYHCQYFLIITKVTYKITSYIMQELLTFCMWQYF